ncbi:hypothetical protein F5878DRAFT_668082 [Lentinula raphanica]|uniref:Uncharacterized protein n=1 Tax=Lentinula raphanica TaxID=153919 RepID=A0AA38U239_9AGAR|nr:hypothetical protein F5878DRAFT_668082 [Lentinula raphanica]
MAIPLHQDDPGVIYVLPFLFTLTIYLALRPPAAKTPPVHISSPIAPHSIASNLFEIMISESSVVEADRVGRRTRSKSDYSPFIMSSVRHSRVSSHHFGVHSGVTSSVLYDRTSPFGSYQCDYSLCLTT